MTTATPDGLDGWVPWPHDLAERYRREGYWQGKTLGVLLAEWACTFGDRVAVVDGDQRITYAQLNRRATLLAARLGAQGLVARDRVIVQLPNGAPFLVLVLALFRLGALPIMALPAHRQHEIGHLAAFSQAVAYAIPARLGGFDHRELARAVARMAPALRLVLVTGGDAEEFADLDRLAADDPAATLPDLPRGPEAAHVALFLLSGGTTGLPKLIPRTHDDYAYNLRASAEVCGLLADDVYLVSVPIGHNFPLACPGVLGTLSVGGRVVTTPAGDTRGALDLVAREGVTVTALVPALALRWMDEVVDARSRGAAPDLSSLRLVQVGGARLVDKAAARLRPTLGATLQQVFGMAEGLLNYTRLDDDDAVLVGTQGRPLSPADELRVVDALGAPVPDGHPGTLETRGPYTLRGYWRVPEHNARAFSPDGFYRTGDVVRRLPDGNLVVEGREKDLINRGGEKISAEEVENLILAQEAVAGAAVVAMPDPVFGERSCAYVVLRQPGLAAGLDLESLVAGLRRLGLAAYKLPERLEIVDTLPLTNVGKVDKAALRRDIAARLDRNAVSNSDGEEPR